MRFPHIETAFREDILEAIPGLTRENLKKIVQRQKSLQTGISRDNIYYYPEIDEKRGKK